MPELDGLDTLKAIAEQRPETEVIMVSGANSRAADATVKALELGALDFVRKPEGATPEESAAQLAGELGSLIRGVSTRRNLRRARAERTPEAEQAGPAPKEDKPPPPPPAVEPGGEPPCAPGRGTPRMSGIAMVAIAVSTGGPSALSVLIPMLPAELSVPVLVVQHMPPLFTASLAQSLDAKSSLNVREAAAEEVPRPGEVLLAPGGKHLVVRRKEVQGRATALTALSDAPPEHGCRPSADVLFRSLAALFPGQVLAVVMTGMGSDGCEGVRAMKRRGCYCITQSQETCVVYGMPHAVMQEGLSDESVPLPGLAERIAAQVNRFSQRR
jgi:two-component system chemotaxis response regulator CheB